MKKIFSHQLYVKARTFRRVVLAVLLSVSATLITEAKAAVDASKGVTVSDATLMREGDDMTASMAISYDGLKVKSSGATVITPMIVNGRDTVRLSSVGIYGRTAWYASRRNDRMPLSGSRERSMRYDRHLAPTRYLEKTEYKDWMNGADLILEIEDYGCAGCNRGKSDLSPLAHYQKVDYKPVFIYQTAVAAEVKTRELAGRAFIDFPVNKTVIYPDYRRNSVELQKILATIDSVKNDRDITVTSIAIKGFASPEGSYANNTRLAQGRTEALKNYVQQLYHFQPGFIKTSFEPEDWQGLREYVENSTLGDKAGILAVINDPMMDPDTKDATIKKLYPSSYSFLLQNVYPSLRHSDYRIEYNIRSFIDPVEIRELIVKEPGKLSLNEFYIAIQGLEPGSDQYNEIFETAVRMFPNEPVANLNAANAMMQRGDLVGAERYLERAGESAEAVYARGVLAALKGDYGKALPLVERAISMGIKDDSGILEHLKEVAKYN